MYKIKCVTLVRGALGYVAGKVCLGHGALEILAERSALLLKPNCLSIPEHALAVGPPA
jgi:hypothetical protein